MTKSKPALITDEISEEIIRVAGNLAKQYGAQNVNVRRVLKEMDVSNRVFYNRFRNIDEALEIVYKNAVFKMHESINSKIDIETDFFGYVLDVVTNVLINTYEIKKQFSHYMFEHDSLTETNRVWWKTEIEKLIAYAKSKNLIKDVDVDMLSYSIWCFCRGFNADAVARGLSKEEAAKCFKFGFGCLLDGIKKQK